MQVVNVRELKNNPSRALRDARSDLVVVMNRDRPDAMLVGMEQLEGIPEFAQVRQALAVGLFRDRRISITLAAKVAGRGLADMLGLVSKLGIPVADASEDDLRAERALGESVLAERDAQRGAEARR